MFSSWTMAEVFMRYFGVRAWEAAGGGPVWVRAVSAECASVTLKSETGIQLFWDLTQRVRRFCSVRTFMMHSQQHVHKEVGVIKMKTKGCTLRTSWAVWVNETIWVKSVTVGAGVSQASGVTYCCPCKTLVCFCKMSNIFFLDILGCEQVTMAFFGSEPE